MTPTSSDHRTVVLAAGGTAGHVFPALALYQALRDRGDRAYLLTDHRGLRYADAFAPADRRVLPSGGLVTGSVVKRVTNLGKLAAGLLQARTALKQIKPDAVIGLGGYAAFGPIVAARQLGIPTVLHDQNSVMGLANKATARFATSVALSFDPTEGAEVAAGKSTITGNPSRAGVVAIGALPYPPLSPTDHIGILIMGGSQGARSVSETVPAALAALPEEMRLRLRVVHQGRSEDHGAVRSAYAAAKISADVVAFVDVPEILPTTHLVIARSGASAVCDMAVAGRPAVYLPLLTHSDLQQVKNAQAVVNAGGALIHREDQRSTADLTQTVQRLLGDPNELRQMAAASRQWSRPDAVDAILGLI